MLVNLSDAIIDTDQKRIRYRNTSAYTSNDMVLCTVVYRPKEKFFDVNRDQSNISSKYLTRKNYSRHHFTDTDNYEKGFSMSFYEKTRICNHHQAIIAKSEK
jgi:hypothetical protein